MYEFQNLTIGDMFNDKVARWVKTSLNEAICVMSAIVITGTIKKFQPDHTVVLLWSCCLKSDEDIQMEQIDC